MRTPFLSFRVFGTMLLVLGIAGSAHAQIEEPLPNPSYEKRLSNSLQGDARAAFGRATDLFNVGNFAAARVEFDQAFSLSGDARALYNVAVCDKELGRYARAIGELRRSLEVGGSKLPRSYVKRVEDTIRTLEPFVTTLYVETSHAKATVLVDGEPAGTTPLERPLVVDVGERVVQLSKAGFRGDAVRLKVVSGVPGNLRLDLEPVEQRERITIRALGLAAGERAEVLVDGVVVGEAPWSGDVLTGQRRIMVRAAGHPGVVRVMEVRPGSRAEVTLRVDPADRKGRLRIRTADGRDTILLNGKVLGRGSYDGQVSAGDHALRVTRPGARTYDMDFVLRPGETRTMNITLDSSGSGVPAWVWIAGGVVVAGATTATLLLTNKETQYDGQTAGTLPPRVVPASYTFGGY